MAFRIKEEHIYYLRNIGRQILAAPENERPLAVCCNCNRMFLKSRKSQMMCSRSCFKDQWNKNKKLNDPSYWARKKAASRNKKTNPS